MSIYAGLAATASSLLAQYKTGAVAARVYVVTEGAGVFDDRVVANTFTPIDAYVKAVDHDRIDGTRIQVGDLDVFFPGPALSSAPTADDVIEIDGVPHAVGDVKRVPAAGTAVLWRVTVRR